MPHDNRPPGYPPTPELDKMLAARERLGTQQIGEFFEWLQEQGIFLSRSHKHDESCYDDARYPTCGYHSGGLEYLQEPMSKLLERYADVDAAKVEEERRAILAWTRDQITKQEEK